jgi:hypothetical protein
MQNQDVPETLSGEFIAWREAPGRSVAAAVVGMSACWTVAGAYVLGTVDVTPGIASVDVLAFLLLMSLPAGAGILACVRPRIRYLAGSAIPGFVAGWVLAWVPIVAAAGVALVA